MSSRRTRLRFLGEVDRDGGLDDNCPYRLTGKPVLRHHKAHLWWALFILEAFSA
jgi:hypothetical protein